ncbi:hypothetical protein HPP92_006298 [Vanilla planifolia]|uniref:Mannan endo-1,4-beta-mannosidase n=1 Tax=Vanilla planifolia TaxID=51239 RepID=A0A835RR74_VANPL|nr:hypothetical protein HPP92_006298 [Vanilla planifolia]
MPTSRSSSPIKAVNLGGWLVTEGWITPNLFDQIPINKDLLDGTQIRLKSVAHNKYLSSKKGGGSTVDANRQVASGWETFKCLFVDLLRPTQMAVTANHPEDTNWGDNDPSVFLLSVVGQLQGEFQVTNGYGLDKASSVMTEHWNNFIVEDDFKFMSENGLTATRIPVGWWIMFDPNPPSPFVGGSLQALDNAFSWQREIQPKDYHRPPRSTRLAEWYASRSGLYAIELINEPLAPGVILDTLKRYYKAGYDVVRKYTDAYVIMSNRLSISDPTELVQFCSGFEKSVIDVHYYNLFSSIFDGMTVQQNINYVYHNRASTLGSLTMSNGPLIFVGEWVDEMGVNNASKGDYQHFGATQLDVYGRATFGWSYWTLKNVDEHWSLEWMIKNGYIRV